MAKAVKEEESTALETVKLDVSDLFGAADLESIRQEYGVTPQDVTIPVPATPTKANFDELCIYKTPVYDASGNLYDDLNGHTGPLMFLGKEGEYDGDKFADYDGFYVYAVAVPQRGKVIITMGRPKGEKRPAIVAYMDGLTKGQLLQVASFKTSKDFRVFNPIPVQQDGKLLH